MNEYVHNTVHLYSAYETESSVVNSQTSKSS